MSATVGWRVAWMLLATAAWVQGVVVFDEPDSFAKIDAARAAGELDDATALRYKVMAWSPRRAELPAAFHSDAPITCGTPLADELAQQWPELPRAVKDELIALDPHCALYDVVGGPAALLNAYSNHYPTLTNRVVSKSGYFVIHYTTVGSNAVGSAGFPKLAAHTFDRVAKSLERMYGKKAKNDDHVHVYLACIGGLGMCTYYPADASGAPPTAASYIEILCSIEQKTNPNYKKYGEHLALGTMAHEYFHAVQNNIDCREGLFMKETSSAWMEGVAFPQNKTYIVIANRLPYANRHPNWQIWRPTDNFYYAMMLFQQYLAERYRSKGINKELWDACATTAGDNGVAAVGTVLIAHGSKWEDAIRDYGMYNYCLRFRDYRAYRDIWPALWTVTNWSVYGVEPQTSVSTDPNALHETGSHFIALNPPADHDSKKGNELLVDVAGVWNTMDYPLKYKAHIRGPAKVHDGVSDLVIQTRNGLNRENVLYFNAGSGKQYTPGVFRLGVQFIFGSTKAPSSRTAIVWCAVRCRPVDSTMAAMTRDTNTRPHLSAAE